MADLLWIRRLEERKALQDVEVRLKDIYSTGGSRLFDSPFDPAGQNDPAARSLYPANLTLQEYPDIEEAESGQAESNTIDFSLHIRYSLPILHKHPFVELIYVYSGNGMLFTTEKTLPLISGDLCLIAPDIEHALSVTNDETLIIRIKMGTYYTESSFLSKFNDRYILRDFFRSILSGHSVSPYILFRTSDHSSGDNDVWMQSKFASIYVEFTGRNTAYREFMELELREILISVVRWYESSAIVAESSSNRLNDTIAGLLSYISKEYNHISLTETAAHFNYNEAYISRLLKKYTGKTFKSIVMEIQMHNAKGLIDEGRLSLTEIAQEIGCYDESHFSRRFTEYYGQSPKQYKESMRK